MEVKIHKLVPEAIIPQYSNPGDAALDLTAVSLRADKENKYIEYGTGLSIEIPENHVGLLFPRSSISDKAMFLTNSVGVVDSGYRGEIKARFRAWDSPEYKVGDRVIQLLILPLPTITFVEVPELGESLRGEAGFGSTN